MPRAVDPDPHSFSLMDPFLGGENREKNRIKCKERGIKQCCGAGAGGAKIIFGNLESEPKINLNTHFMLSVWTLEDASRVSALEPGYLAGDGAVTLARVRLHLKYLLNNSRKLHETKPHLMSFLK